MAKRKAKKSDDADSIFFLKLVIYMIVGSFWVKLTFENGQLPVPVGPILGLWYARHEHFQIDRKIEYAILLMAALVGFWAPVGVYIVF